jgi:regulator of sirC expression with transglutaminase-like and TPR domain
MRTRQDIIKDIEELASLRDDAFPLFQSALYLAALNHEGRGLAPYNHHLEKMVDDVRVRHTDLLTAGADDNGATRIAAIKHIVADKYGYQGDKDTYNDIRNADVIDVIDRRKGLPIALAIITIEVGRAQGWTVQGINFPGHFLIRFDHLGERVMCDPFTGFKILQAADLRNLLKQALGDKAELSSSFYQEATNREILVRLQNNIKYRQIETEHYADALETVRVMRLFAPDEFRLLLDDGVLKARLDKTADAIQSIRQYLNHVTDPHDKYDAQILLRSLENRL